MTSRRPRVLIVDDDPLIRSLLRKVVERGDLDADEACDGVQCLDLLDRNRYDLVLLDLAMPRLNGFDVVLRLRRRTERPAVLVLTSLPSSTFLDLDPDVVHCVIRKPFDISVLAEIIASTATAMRDAGGMPSVVPAVTDPVRLRGVEPC